MDTNPFPVTRIAHVTSSAAAACWLVEDLWGDQAVGFIAGTPKAGKTWLALELAVAVASGKPCLGRYPVRQRGHVLLYAAEDSAMAIKQRVMALAHVRDIPDLERLAVGLIGTPELRLDLDEHQKRLERTLAQLKPRLLILDPLVRLHRGDENSAADVSQLLGFLRRLQRDHGVAIVLVHHIRKSGSTQPGQSLRGSGDLHAWSDSSLYLLRKADRIELHAEHRAHPSPPPLQVELCASPDIHLRLTRDEKPEQNTHTASFEPIAPRVLEALRDKPMSRAALRRALAVRNERLTRAIQELEARGELRRCDGMLVAVAASAPDADLLHHPSSPTYP